MKKLLFVALAVIAMAACTNQKPVEAEIVEEVDSTLVDSTITVIDSISVDSIAD